MLYGVSGTNVGHELTHRTWSKPAQIVGRWLLAFTCDASFSIEHVYGHHKHVATRQDPATLQARRERLGVRGALDGGELQGGR